MVRFLKPGEGYTGGLPPVFQKNDDFVSEKGCKSQGCRNEDSNSYIFEEATRIYLVSFDVIQV